MTTINESPDKIREVAMSLVADATDGELNGFAHSGVKGMKWGVWNDETKRKYGIAVRKAATDAMRSAGRTAKAVKGTAEMAKQAAGIKMKAAASNVQKASSASIDRLKEKAAERKAQKAVEKEQRKSIGMSKAEFDKLRDKTLKSHDPRVIEKGMKTLTDDELKDKIARLEQEDRIARLAESNRSRSTKDLQNKFNMIKASPLYDVLADPVKTVAKDAIVNQLYGAGLGPMLNQRVSYASAKNLKKFAEENPGAATAYSPLNAGGGGGGGKKKGKGGGGGGDDGPDPTKPDMDRIGTPRNNTSRPNVNSSTNANSSTPTTGDKIKQRLNTAAGKAISNSARKAAEKDAERQADRGRKIIENIANQEQYRKDQAHYEKVKADGQARNEAKAQAERGRKIIEDISKQEQYRKDQAHYDKVEAEGRARNETKRKYGNIVEDEGVYEIPDSILKSYVPKTSTRATLPSSIAKQRLALPPGRG